MPRKGQTMSAEARARISAYQRGRKRSPEVGAKISAAKRGNVVISVEQPARIAATLRGKREAIERFLDYVAVQQDGCWLWTGGTRPTGKYGAFGFEGRTVRAHIWAYHYFIGEYDAESIDHLCRVTLCVNPYHLEPVSFRENSLRGESPAAQNARKAACVRGHLFDEANTRQVGPNAAYPHGRRDCRACARQRRHGMEART